jgi:hypothetical protein
MEDSRVFRDQTVPGFPRLLAQKCGNRNGRLLVLEEYNSRGNAGLFLSWKEETDKDGINFLRSSRMSFNFLLIAGKSRREKKKKKKKKKKKGIRRFCLI